MVERKTIRPVTLRRVIEICSLATKTKKVNVTITCQKLGVSPSRAREIILEVEKMGLLKNIDDADIANDRTIKFLEHFETEQWDKTHEYFLANYQFYQDFIRILEDHINEDKGLSMNEIKEESAKLKLGLNQTAVEVLANWCERLGVIQRHLYTKRLYSIENETVNSNSFKIGLVRCYHELSLSRWRKGSFVEIPKLRETMCEQLKVPRRVFDEMLRAAYLENVGKIELSGAPITTLAKKSPLSEKKMKLEGKAVILSPKFEVKREREGLTVGRKSYYYLAIHEDI